MSEPRRRRAAPRTLLARRLKDSDFPIHVGRNRWIDLLTLVVMAALLAVAGFLVWLLATSVIDPGFGTIFLCLFVAMLLLGLFTGIDNVGYRLTIDPDGLVLTGRLQSFRLYWTEINALGTWRGRAVTDDGIFFLGFHQARIFVDGSNNPARLSRNLYFKGYFLPPFMVLGGQDLVKLIRKAGRHFDHDIGDPPRLWAGSDQQR